VDTMNFEHLFSGLAARWIVN